MSGLTSDLHSNSLNVTALGPAVLAAGAAHPQNATNEIDTKGWRWAVVALQIGTNTATANGLLTVQQSEALIADGGTYVDIDDPVVGTTSNNPVVVNAEANILPADDDTIVEIAIDLSMIDRYIQVAFTQGTGGTNGAVGATVRFYGADSTKQSVSAPRTLILAHA